MERDTEEYDLLTLPPFPENSDKVISSEDSVVSPEAESVSPLKSKLATSQVQEFPQNVLDELQARGFIADGSGIVQWKSDSHLHPRNWAIGRKLYNTGIIIFLEFFMTMISNTGSSIAPEVMSEFGITRVIALFSFTTCYLLGQAIGGLVLPPIAESFGSDTIYASASFGFGIFSLIIGLVTHLPALIVGRFVTGFFSAMPSVVAAGSLEEMWDIRARIFVFNTWVSAAVVGLGLAPTLATLVCMSPAGWPAIYYGAGGVSILVGFLALGMRESRPAQLLRRQVRTIRKRTDYQELTVSDGVKPSFKKFLRESLVLPVRLFFTEPILFATSVMTATIFGVIYLFSEVLGSVYIDGYDFTRREGNMIFLTLAVGVVFTFLPRIYDVHVTNMEHTRLRPIEPEDKLFGFYVAAPVFAIALWWFGATVPPLVHVSPGVSVTSLALIGFSAVEFDSVLSGYLTDSYLEHAAIANAPLAFLRAILSGTFPLFGTPYFNAVGPNVAVFILAGLATIFIGVAALFGKYGKTLRVRSKFAEATIHAHDDDGKESS